MIGTNIRSVRHLFRVSDASLKTLLVRFKENSWDICKAIKMPKNTLFGETLLIFNNCVRQSHWNHDTVLSSKDFQKYVKSEDVMNFCRIISINPEEFGMFDNVFKEIIVLPDSFEKDYDKFIKENSKMISTLTSKFGYSTRDVRSKVIYMYSDGSKNFYQWAMTAYYQNGIGMSTIRNILIWNESYKQLAKNLSKGTITAYTTRDSIPILMEELRELRKEKRINDSINSFNTAQKKMLKENELKDDVKQALWRLSRLSDTKRINFIKKMSSVEDFGEFTRQLKFVTSVHFSWSKESFMDFINNVEGIKYEKIFENDSVVLVKILDYETVKQLGKTTNWCISKNKQYWNNYIENHHGMTTQYMVFDFSRVEDDKLSIIGFTTTRNKGITSAHNFINDPLIGGEEPGANVLLESFISKFKDNKNIYSILADDGIDITLVVHYDALPYEWNKEHMLNYLHECVNSENIDVLKDSDNKLVLSVTDENIRYFFGDAYHDNIPSDYFGLQHIIFADFNKNKYDITKLQFAIIENGCGDEDYCNGVYDERSLNDGENFDSKLIEFGLPYNTIRRTNNIKVRLKNAIYSYNTPMFKDCMKSCDTNTLRSVISQNFSYESLYEMITRTVRNYVSFDYLNLFYDNGIYLNEFIPHEYIGDMIKSFLYDIKHLSRATSRFTNAERVTDEDIEKLFNHEIDRREDAKYIGLFVAIKKILQTEYGVDKSKCQFSMKNAFHYMANETKGGEIFEQVIDLVFDKLNFNDVTESILYLLKYTARYGSDVLKAYIEEKCNGNKKLKDSYDDFKSEYEKFNKAMGKKSITVNVTNALEFAYALAREDNNPF